MNVPLHDVVIDTLRLLDKLTRTVSKSKRARIRFAASELLRAILLASTGDTGPRDRALLIQASLWLVPEALHNHKILIIKIVRELRKVDLKTAVDIVNASPCCLIEDVSPPIIKIWKKAFHQAGLWGFVTVKPSADTLPTG